MATDQQILTLFRRIADHYGTTVLIATRDLAVDACAGRVVHLQDGRVVERQVGG